MTITTDILQRGCRYWVYSKDTGKLIARAKGLQKAKDAGEAWRFYNPTSEYLIEHRERS